MALRYDVEVLLHLRESPLCVRPSALPPAEEWMGPPPENFRNSTQGSKIGNDRNRNSDSTLLEQTNRRPGVERHISRNSANPEEIILGPPRTTFNSATLSRGGKLFDSDKISKDNDNRDRFNYRSRNGEADNAERNRDRDRDGRNSFRRRGDGDQDSDGWSTVKPRKSFGHEGAEHFHGYMGGPPNRSGAERKPRDPDDRENTERPRRTFGEFSKDKDVEDGERPRRNGLNRNKPDQPWTRENNDNPQPRHGFDRSKSWRDKAGDDYHDPSREKPRERTYDRRWDRDRDHRQEREPEWLDEPVEEQLQSHTQEDFKKFMESMKSKNAPKTEPTITVPAAEKPARQENIEAKTFEMKATPTIELGEDKFFAAFGQKPGKDVQTLANDNAKETTAPASKAKTGSRFQNFFSTQEETRRQTEPPTPVTLPSVNEINPLLAMAGAQHPENPEKVAFQALLQKLQKQTLQASTPPSAGFAEPPPSNEYGPKTTVTSPGPFPSYSHERRDEAISREAPFQSEHIQGSRTHQTPQYAAMRPDQQMLHDLIHRQGPVRADKQPSRNSNSNAEFLMTLMQSSRGAIPLETRRNEPPIMRMPQPSRPAHLPPTPDRESDYQRERSASQHQGGRPIGLAQFFDEAPLYHGEPESRPQQPTQILQRQGPPGLDQMHPNAWMQQAGQQLPPQGRPMIPPPGLAGNPRNGPMPGVFPSNFPGSGFPHNEGIGGPPRNMAPPPGFFGGPPPPGFMPPPGMGGFQGGSEALAFGYDGRGMPPPGSGAPFRRN